MHCVQKASRLLFPGGWKRLVVLLRWSIEVPETCIFIIEYELNVNPGLINYKNALVYRSGMYYSTFEYFRWSLTTLGANIPRTNQGVWIWRWHHFMCTAGCKGPSFTGWDSPTRGWQIGKSCPMNHSEQGKHANISDFFGYLSGFINHSNWTSMGPSLNSMGDWGRALAYGSLGHGLGIWNVGRPGPANLRSLRRLESEESEKIWVYRKIIGFTGGFTTLPGLVN